MGVSRTIIWAMVALIIEVSAGFAFHDQISSLTGLKAQTLPPLTDGWVPIDKIACAEVGGIWTGNGCAKPWLWTPGDWDYYRVCISNAYNNPPPPLPAKAVTEDESRTCAKLTEAGKGRK